MKKFITLVVFFALFSISAPVLALEALTLTVTTSDVNVTLSWTSVTGATGYTLFYAPYPDASYIGQIDMGTQTSISFDANGLAFYVAIQSYNNSGNSEYSNIEYFDLAVPNSTSYESYYRPHVTSGNLFTYRGSAGGLTGRAERFVEEGTVQFNNSTVKVVSCGDNLGYWSLDSNGLAYHGKYEAPKYWSTLGGEPYDTTKVINPPVKYPMTFTIGDTFTTNHDVTRTRQTGTYWDTYTGNAESTVSILENETISIPLGEFSAVKIRSTLITNLTYAENSYGQSKTGNLGELEEIRDTWFVKDIGIVKDIYKVDGILNPSLENYNIELEQINFTIPSDPTVE